MFCPIAQSTALVLWLTHFDTNASGWIEERGRTVTTHGTVDVFVPLSGEPAYKFGPAAAGFPGVGFSNYLSAPNTALFQLGATPFVWDCWVPKVPATAHPNVIFAVAKDGVSLFPSCYLHAESDSGAWGFTFQVSSDQAGNSYDAVITASTPNDISHNFHYIRCGRIDDTTVGLSLDGATPVTAAIPAGCTFTPDASALTTVGWGVNGDTSQNTWAGAIDELCCRATAMNSTSFTPPTQPFRYP